MLPLPDKNIILRYSEIKVRITVAYRLSHEYWNSLAHLHLHWCYWLSASSKASNKYLSHCLWNTFLNFVFDIIKEHCINGNSSPDNAKIAYKRVRAFNGRYVHAIHTDGQWHSFQTSDETFRWNRLTRRKVHNWGRAIFNFPIIPISLVADVLCYLK